MIKNYTCQACSKSSTDNTLFKMLVGRRIGFIICNNCLKDWGKDEEE